MGVCSSRNRVEKISSVTRDDSFIRTDSTQEFGRTASHAARLDMARNLAIVVDDRHSGAGSIVLKHSQSNKMLMPEDKPVVDVSASDDDSVRSFQPEKEDIVFSDLRMIRSLGKGQFGQVYHFRHEVPGGKDYALKYIRKKTDSNSKGTVHQKIVAEIRMLRKVSNHVNVTRLVKTFESAEYVFILMDLCEEGDLWSYMFKIGGTRGEQFAKVLTKQIIHGIRHLHSHDIVHRDLKLENVLLTANQDFVPAARASTDSLQAKVDDNNLIVKIADFGMAALSVQGERFSKRFVGTRGYAAPEVHEETGQYGKPADMWAVGVITYVLLAGYHPFDPCGKGFSDDMKQRILSCDWSFEDSLWRFISPSAKDFVANLLVRDPQKRMTAVEARAHRWISGAVVPAPSASWEVTTDEMKRMLPQRSVFAAGSASIDPSLYDSAYGNRHYITEVLSRAPSRVVSSVGSDCDDRSPLNSPTLSPAPHESKETVAVPEPPALARPMTLPSERPPALTRISSAGELLSGRRKKRTSGERATSVEFLHPHQVVPHPRRKVSHEPRKLSSRATGPAPRSMHSITADSRRRLQ